MINYCSYESENVIFIKFFLFLRATVGNIKNNFSVIQITATSEMKYFNFTIERAIMLRLGGE